MRRGTPLGSAGPGEMPKPVEKEMEVAEGNGCSGSGGRAMM